MHLHLCIYLLTLLCILTTFVRGASDCIIPRDTNEQLKAANYVWDYLNRLDSATHPEQRVTTYTAGTSIEGGLSLSINVTVPSVDNPAHQNIIIDMGKVTVISIRDPQTEPLSSAMKFEFAYGIGEKNDHGYFKNVQVATYLVGQENPICFVPSEEAGYVAQGLLTVTAYRLKKLPQNSL